MAGETHSRVGSATRPLPSRRRTPGGGSQAEGEEVPAAARYAAGSSCAAPGSRHLATSSWAPFAEDARRLCVARARVRRVRMATVVRGRALLCPGRSRAPLVRGHRSGCAFERHDGTDRAHRALLEPRVETLRSGSPRSIPRAHHRIAARSTSRAPVRARQRAQAWSSIRRARYLFVGSDLHRMEGGLRSPSTASARGSSSYVVAERGLEMARAARSGGDAGSAERGSGAHAAS